MIQPIVQIDTREKVPWHIEGYPTVRAALAVGDYGISGFSDWDCPRFICERKSLDDLVGSLTHGRERFWRECEKLRAFGFAALIVEAHRMEVEMHQYASAANPASILASLDALEVRHGIHILWAGDAGNAARRVGRPAVG